VLVPSEIDVVALLLRPEVHLQPEFLQGVVVVRPSVGKFNNDNFFENYNNSLLNILFILFFFNIRIVLLSDNPAGSGVQVFILF
jgi:hypothetical protein